MDLLGKKATVRVSAFTCLLKNGPLLRNEHQIQLLQPYTVMEVKAALFHIDSNKSPGPDGYGSGFFKAAWDIIGDDIVTAVLQFFTNGKLLKQLNATNIALIQQSRIGKPVKTNSML
ncbi:hypothetical protein KY290_006149 [Solanum tuberosum]|uniref:RNA-directed DNA polymerase (Reverse transcriptase) n=1 Tax=Solanum tuberosum TaxID=4113 RepID=A0ABQ7WG49_SOLTU|nr:hypothetical protein KY284_006262 [Solanum tuberosum]KAH0779722.1 hypothetical protein KY290_006149 [Solanum tuberosum]